MKYIKYFYIKTYSKYLHFMKFNNSTDKNLGSKRKGLLKTEEGNGPGKFCG